MKKEVLVCLADRCNLYERTVGVICDPELRDVGVNGSGSMTSKCC